MFWCMRTTLHINDELMRRAKLAAAATGRTLTAVVEDALTESLARREPRKRRGRVRLTTFRGRGLQPGVDLDDSAALSDLMERRHDPR